MKKLFCILSCLLAAGCTSFEGNPYGDTLRSLSVQVVYPEEYASFLREGVPGGKCPGALRSAFTFPFRDSFAGPSVADFYVFRLCRLII